MFIHSARKRSALALSVTALGILANACSSDPDSSDGKTAAGAQALAAPAAPISAAATALAVQQWQAKVHAVDPSVRAEGAELIVGTPGTDGAVTLERLIANDPDVSVRERSVFAYGQLQKRAAIPLLKNVALSNEDENVVAAALASLAEIREESPEPARGFLTADFPQTFPTGAPFDVKVRFGSSEAVPRAQLALKLPPQLELISPEEPRWIGALAKNETIELTFSLRAKAEQARTGAAVSLTLDYPEKLDVEVHKHRVRAAIDPQAGRFEQLPPAQTQTP